MSSSRMIISMKSRVGYCGGIYIVCYIVVDCLQGKQS